MDWLQWTATSTGIVAAILVAANLGAKITGWGFAIFIASSIAWISFALMSGQQPLALQNGVLLIVNIGGVYRYWVRLPQKRKAGATDAKLGEDDADGKTGAARSPG